MLPCSCSGGQPRNPSLSHEWLDISFSYLVIIKAFPRVPAITGERHTLTGLGKSESKLWGRSWSHHPLEGVEVGVEAKSELWGERRSRLCGADVELATINVCSTALHKQRKLMSSL